MYNIYLFKTNISKFYIMLDIHQPIIEKLDDLIDDQKIPHIIFHGASGSGKRYILDYFIKKIYNNNQQHITDYTMYVNCAHGKGIRFIRDELKFFAKTNIQKNKYSFFKSIILFNADNLTIDAQSALRRCIETFSETTRFFIVIDSKNNLLKPILSRFCNIYIPLPKNPMTNDSINLHFFKKEMYTTNSYYIKRNIWLKKEIVKDKNYKNIKSCTKFILKLYKNGYSALDILDYINNHYQEKNKYLFLVYFDKIRKEFRNEKLLMFCILYFTFMRKKIDIKNILSM